jgi:pimeloyl-ACP methyl ester carboxylesterase
MPLLAAAGPRVVALDPRGMGDSDRPNSDYDMRTVVAEVHDFTEAVGSRQKVLSVSLVTMAPEW